MIDDSMIIEGLNISLIKSEIKKITKNMNLENLNPKFVFFSNKTNTLKMHFSGDWKYFSDEDRNKIFNYYEYGLRTVLGNNIQRVGEFRISKELIYV